MQLQTTSCLSRSHRRLSSAEFLCVPTSLKTTIFRKRTGNELIVQRSQVLVTSQHRETATVPLNRRAKPDPDVTENGPSQTASTWSAINVHRAKAYVLLSPQSYSWSVQRLRASRNGSESRWLFPIQPPVSPLSCPWSPPGFISSFYPVTSLATSLTSTAVGFH